MVAVRRADSHSSPPNVVKCKCGALNYTSLYRQHEMNLEASLYSKIKPKGQTRWIAYFLWLQHLPDGSSELPLISPAFRHCVASRHSNTLALWMTDISYDLSAGLLLPFCCA